MKKVPIILVIALLLMIVRSGFGEEKNLKGTITISGAWAIYPTVVEWAAEFQKNILE